MDYGRLCYHVGVTLLTLVSTVGECYVPASFFWRRVLYDMSELGVFGCGTYLKYLHENLLRN